MSFCQSHPYDDRAQRHEWIVIKSTIYIEEGRHITYVQGLFCPHCGEQKVLE